MKSKHKLSIGVAAVAAALVSQANAGTLAISYFKVTEPNTSGDFGICCSSPPATSANVSIGDALGSSGLVVNHGNVVDTNASGEILWWTAGSHNGDTVTFTGSAVVSLPYGSNMFAPNSTGSNNNDFFETATLSGVIHGAGADVHVNVSGDDDVFVYVDGKYAGGVPGVHGVGGASIDLGALSGSHSLNVFYADRAQTGAYLSVDVVGADVMAAPEPSTWAMMGLGFAGLGFAGWRSRRTPGAVFA